ncbi:alpha-tocopherol transfer protein-like isoform X1 [Bacillus rossius redtenbacheri]|uniref:alpha-tocopherol transfer protein-like isoform X1 n=1 Tax=Bacillus rossius redtenbacheri TaxID=93214 RepID=UPI002FDE0294
MSDEAAAAAAGVPEAAGAAWEDVSPELDLGPPPEAVLEYARQHLGESPDTKMAAVQELRDLVYERGEAQPHRTDDAFLVRFLRARRFDVEKAHQLMVDYYSFKEANPDLHEDVHPLRLRFIGEDGVMSALPYRDQTGRRVIIYRIGQWRPGAYSVDELLKTSVLLMELAVLEARTQVLGYSCIFDMAGLSLYHAWNVTPSVAAKVVQLLVSSFPIRTHGIHIVNQSWVFDIIFSIFRPLLNERMRSKIHFHGADMESLHAHVQPKYLPERYGGCRPEYSYTQWLDSLTRNTAIIKEMESLGYVFDPAELSQDADLIEDSQSGSA